MSWDEACEVLGLDAAASLGAEQLRRAYLRLVKIHKPEIDPLGFRRLREAYECLRELVGEDGGDGAPQRGAAPAAPEAEPRPSASSSPGGPAVLAPSPLAAPADVPVTTGAPPPPAGPPALAPMPEAPAAAGPPPASSLPPPASSLPPPASSPLPPPLPPPARPAAPASGGGDQVDRDELDREATRLLAAVFNLLAEGRVGKAEASARSLQQLLAGRFDLLPSLQLMRWSLARELIDVGRGLPEPLRIALGAALRDDAPLLAARAIAELVRRDPDGAARAAHYLLSCAPALAEPLAPQLRAAVSGVPYEDPYDDADPPAAVGSGAAGGGAATSDPDASASAPAVAVQGTAAAPAPGAAPGSSARRRSGPHWFVIAGALALVVLVRLVDLPRREPAPAPAAALATADGDAGARGTGDSDAGLAAAARALAVRAAAAAPEHAQLAGELAAAAARHDCRAVLSKSADLVRLPPPADLPVHLSAVTLGLRARDVCGVDRQAAERARPRAAVGPAATQAEPAP